ncbi:MAG: Gfo/Idh/MocA family oxidoreductase [Fibrobacterota bacterium]
MSEKILNAAVVGVGVMGRNHVRVLSEMPHVHLEATCDPHTTPDTSVAHYSDLDTLLSQHRIDFVVIAVPTPLHDQIAFACIDRGIHLLIEKPAASRAPKAGEIARAAERKKIKTAVGHIERFNPVVEALSRELENKEIFSISISRIGPLPPRVKDVGILTDLAVHDIDLIRLITHKEILNTSIYKSRKIHYHNEDNAVLLFQLQNDILANITTNWLTPFKKRKIEVATNDTYFEADLISQELREFSALSDDDSYVKTRSCPVHKGEPLVNELQAFVNFVNTGDRGNLATIEDSILTLEIIDSVSDN